MGAIRFRLRSLLLFMTAVAVAVWVVARGADEVTTLDLTKGQASTCAVHGVRMAPKLVPLEFGMRRFLVIDEVRPRLFPHADEPYDTGWCMPPREKDARVYVCRRCTKARADWLQAKGKEAFAMAP